MTRFLGYAEVHDVHGVRDYPDGGAGPAGTCTSAIHVELRDADQGVKCSAATVIQGPLSSNM